VKLLVDGSQVFAVDVGIDLRRRQIGVPQHFLYGAEIGPALE
jgi:hypothetical protein